MPRKKFKNNAGESEMIPYDLLDVEWGDEILRARPISWNKDLASEDINPEEAEDVFVTGYELVCPKCGSRCEFKIYDFEILCDCGASTTNPVYELPSDTKGNVADIENNIEDDMVKDIENDNDILEDIEKAKEPDTEIKESNTEKRIKSPDEILDSLTESITNTEILLEPDEEDKEEVKKSKQSIKKLKKKKPKNPQTKKSE